MPYRVPAPRPPAPPLPPDPYMTAWAQLRRCRRLVAVGLAGWLTTMFVLLPVLDRLCIPFATANWVLLVLASCGACGFTCPNCGEAFAARDWFTAPRAPDVYFRTRCVHCGIAIGTPKSAVGCSHG